jgi:chorismate mutase
MDHNDDPTVKDFRERITATDDDLVALVNRRVALVAGLHAHKREQGYETVDPDRERTLLEHLDSTNQGPISAEGLHSLYATLIPLSIAEAGRINNNSGGPQ